MEIKVITEQVALITGAARRVGAEISRTLHMAGMRVVVHCNHSQQEASELVAQLNQARPHSAAMLQADLNHEASYQRLIDQAAAHWGRLDVLVNNASTFAATKIGNVTLQDWDNLINSNMKAPFFLSQAAAPYLAKQQGVIINITDIHAETPMRDYNVYCMAKSGLVMLTKALAKDLGPAIRVNAVAPGAIMWPEGENSLSEELKQKIIHATVLKRHGTAQDIAQAVLFLIRDGKYVTGHILMVDGGRSLAGD